MKQVLVTGAAGCVGHYVVEQLLAREDVFLHLVCRDPKKLTLPLPEGRTRVIQADVRELASEHAETLTGLDALVHLATAWGDPVSYPVNVDATLALCKAVNPARCRVLYFSTASILGADNRPMEAAEVHGTDYIRSKYLAYRALEALPSCDHVVALFPTLIFGGGDRHPVSHLTRGLPTVTRYLWLLRHLSLDGTLHFIHARDIARMVSHLVDHAPPERDMVLGNAPVTVDGLIGEMCEHYGLDRGKAFDLTPFAGVVAKVAGSRMNSWDRFSLTYKHFQYRATNPRALGMAPGLETIGQILDEWQGRGG